MPQATDPRKALVSVWKHGTEGAQHTFIGSGMFISPCHVLTARHVTCDADNRPIPVWLGQVEGQHDLRSVKEIHRSDEVDVALLELDVPNQHQEWCPVDMRQQDLQGQDITLYGIFSETKSTITIDCNIVSYETDACCYLTDCAQPKGLSGGAATLKHQIIGVISARYRADGLGCIVSISLLSQWLQSFTTLKDFLGVMEVAPASSNSTRTQEMHEALTCAVRKHVHELLQKPALQVLQKTIEQQVGNEKVAEVLTPFQTAQLTTALQHLYRATKSCLENLAEKKSSELDQVRRAAQKMFGWMVVLAVDHERVQTLGLDFDPQRENITLRMPLATEAAIEVFVSSSSKRAARFRRSDSRVTGEDGFPFDGLAIGNGDGLEMGIGRTDQLTEILKRIWQEVFQEDAPHPFGETQRAQLQATLRVQRDFAEKCYYVTVPPDREPVSNAGPQLLSALIQALPALPVIYLHGKQSQGVLILDEHELQAIIWVFLRMLESSV